MRKKVLLLALTSVLMSLCIQMTVNYSQILYHLNIDYLKDRLMRM